jgi:hypothetical protein
MKIKIENHTNISLWTYGFCDIRYYNFDNAVDIINQFISSKYYRMTFVWGYRLDEDVHGQFLVDKISAKNYTQVNENIFKEIINTIKEKKGYFDMPEKQEMEVYNKATDEITRNGKKTYFLLNLSEKNIDCLGEFYWLLPYFYDIIVLDSKNKKLINISFGEA